MEGPSSEELLNKSIYDYDPNTQEGVYKLLELLPIVDSTVIQELSSIVWPGVVVEDEDVNRYRCELRGWLISTL